VECHKKVKGRKMHSCLGGDGEVLIEKRHNKYQKLTFGARVKKKKILNHEHVFWYM